MILVLGLNHKTAPVAIRQQLAFDAPLKRAMLGALKRRFPSSEFVLLSTCNRVELYCAAVAGEGPSADTLLAMLARARGLGHAEFRPCLYVHRNEDAVRHLLSVTASLDSMVVGETEILGQVKESYRVALEAGSTGRTLNRLFHLAVATGKKIHSQTALASSRASVPGLAVELVGRLFSDASARVLVIGAGEMGELLVELLLESGFTNITVVNRTAERGAELAARRGIGWAPWGRLEEEIGRCDAALSAAAVASHMISGSTMAGLMSRRDRDIVIIDIGVPRNFEPAVAELPGVRLYSIDELAPLVCEGPETRSQEIARSFDIVYRTASDFMQWFAARDLGPLIGQMQARFRQIAAQEVSRMLAGQLNESMRQEFEMVVSRIVGKLSHMVIQHVDLTSHEHGPERAADFLNQALMHAEELYADPARMEEFVK